MGGGISGVDFLEHGDVPASYVSLTEGTRRSNEFPTILIMRIQEYPPNAIPFPRKEGLLKGLLITTVP